MDVQKLFLRFNEKYFGGRLPNYRVIQSDLYGSWGICRTKQREIHLSPGLQGSALRIILLHEMAHAASNGRHADLWKKEMRRLVRLGAPLKRELSKYLKSTIDEHQLIAEMKNTGFEIGDRSQWPSVRQNAGYRNQLVDRNGNAESPAAERLLRKFRSAFLTGVKQHEDLKRRRWKHRCQRKRHGA